MNEPRDSIEAMARAGAAAVAEHTEETSNLRVDLARVTEERNALRAAIVEYDVAKLCLARFHPHHRTHTEAGRSAVRRMVDAEAALRALAEVPRG